MHIAILTVSDRASRGEYEDLGGPSIEKWLRDVVSSPYETTRAVIPDDAARIERQLLEFCDERPVDMVLLTGGTGPSPRDVTPEALRRILVKELPGFGEEMRRASLAQTPTAILSRQSAGIRNRTLIISLPGKPSAISVCLDAIFAAVPYCLDLIGAGRIETNPERLISFRPQKV
jgi:molybdopterin adenylyltransferase